jgi:hypothetical protein
MKTIIILFLTSLFLMPVSINFKKLAEIKVNHSELVSDNLGNCYIISKKQIIKYSRKGTKLSEYSNNLYGNISHADVSDPFRILLFYKDFNRIVFLNNQLSELSSPIELDELDGVQAEICCTSSSGGFWIYDYFLTKLMYFDKNLEKKHESANLLTIFRNIGLPEFMIEKNDFLYISFPDKGILLFDRFGSYFKTIPLKISKSFQIIDRNIVYFENNMLYTYNPDLLKTDSLIIPVSDYKNVRREKKLLFCSNNKEIHFFEEE